MFEVGVPLIWVWIVSAIIATTVILLIQQRAVVKYGDDVNFLVLFLVVLLGFAASSIVYTLSSLFNTYETDAYADTVQSREEHFFTNVRISDDAVTSRILSAVGGNDVRYESTLQDILQEQHVSITVLDGDEEIPGILSIHDQEISVTLYEDTEATAVSIE